MQAICIQTRIAAPAMRVFLLSLSVDLHTASAEQTQERAIAGVTSGLMSMGDLVTWQGRHFGLTLRQTAKITSYSPPQSFEDTMIAGAFSSFRHVHRFEATPAGTLMLDELFFQAPFGIVGRVAERFVLKRYLAAFLLKRNHLVRSVAESADWVKYIPEDHRQGCT